MCLHKFPTLNAVREKPQRVHLILQQLKDMSETSAEDVVFEYMVRGLDVVSPKILLVCDLSTGCKRLGTVHLATVHHYKTSQYHLL